MLKLNEMDFGTKLRTVLVIVSSLNTALMATDLTGFENPTVDLIYKIVSLIFNFIIVALTAYFNNSYTKAGATGTEVTRALKSNPDITVEYHDTDIDEADSDEEYEDDEDDDDDDDEDEGDDE